MQANSKSTNSLCSRSNNSNPVKSNEGQHSINVVISGCPLPPQLCHNTIATITTTTTATTATATANTTTATTTAKIHHDTMTSITATTNATTTVATTHFSIIIITFGIIIIIITDCDHYFFY